MKKPLSLDDLRAMKQEMVRVGRLAQQDISPMEVVGVLVSLYRDAELEIERRALSYAVVAVLECSARSGS